MHPSVGNVGNIASSKQGFEINQCSTLRIELSNLTIELKQLALPVEGDRATARMALGWEHSGNIRGTFREHSGNIQGTFGEHSGNIRGTFGEHSGKIQGS
jgi:hypothetical protein